MQGVRDRLMALRGALFGALAFALLLPSALAALSTPDLVREQALYSAILRSLCSGESASHGTAGTPSPLSGCDLCPANCSIGCATPTSVAVELGRRVSPEAAAFRFALAEGPTGGTSRREDGLPRGPPDTLAI